MRIALLPKGDRKDGLRLELLLPMHIRRKGDTEQRDQMSLQHQRLLGGGIDPYVH
jgi:hypothetical protein